MNFEKLNYRKQTGIITLKIIIERSENMFSAYAENAEGIYGGGDSVKEAKQSILDAIAIIVEEFTAENMTCN